MVDPLAVLPDELVLEVFRLLDAPQLARASAVSFDWRRVADDPLLWRDFAVRGLPWRASWCAALAGFRSSAAVQFKSCVRTLELGWALESFGREHAGDIDVRECALRQDGRLRVLSPVDGSVHAVAVIGAATGAKTAFYLTARGDVYGVGSNKQRQLGLGDGIARQEFVTEPMLVALNDQKVVQVAAAERYTLFLTDARRVLAAGWMMHFAPDGPLAGGHFSPVPQPLNWFDGLAVDSLGCGSNFSVAVVDSGRVLLAFGSNNEGQLGIGNSGTVERNEQPVRVQLNGSGACDDARRVRQLSCRATSALCLTEADRVLAWGSNVLGQCGVGLDRSRLELPTEIRTLRGHSVRQLGGGSYHCLAVTADGSVWSWGLNWHGQLGIGGVQSAAEPTRVRALRRQKIVLVSDGMGDHSLAASEDGSLWSWGHGHERQLGFGDCGDVLLPTQPSIRLAPPVRHAPVQLRTSEKFTLILRPWFS